MFYRSSVVLVSAPPSDSGQIEGYLVEPKVLRWVRNPSLPLLFSNQHFMFTELFRSGTVVVELKKYRFS